MSGVYYFTVRAAYEAVRRHISATGHADLICDDDPLGQTIGVHCRHCDTRFFGPHPKPGEAHEWPESMTRPNEAAYRRGHLRKLVEIALEQYANRKTAWERITEDDP